MIGRIKEDILSGTDRFVDKIQEVGAEARKQLRMAELKKDRFLAEKELGELIFRLVTIEGRQQVESDLRVRKIISELSQINNRIDNIDNETGD